MTDPNTPTSTRKRSIPPALVLWFISPIFGEVFSGSTPLNEFISPFMILLLGALYGGGAILIRELLVRWRKGWPSLLLLGMAYGIYEEGLVVRSFFDPNWQDLDNLGVYGRVLGVNWVWTEHLTIFHAVVSIAASIVFVEMLYPGRRAQSWVGKRGLVLNALGFVITLPLVGLLNPYNAPDVWLGVCWLVITLLVYAAWRAPAAIERRSPAAVPRPRRFFFTAFLATIVYHFLIYIPAEQGSPHFVITLFLVVLLLLIILWLVLRWSNGARDWDDCHRFALLCGPLVFFLILGLLIHSQNNLVFYFSSPIFLVLLWWAYRRVDQRVKGESASLLDAP